MNSSIPCDGMVPNYSVQDYIRLFHNMANVILFGMFIIIGAKSLILAYNRLVRKGVSSGARYQFLANHGVYLFVFTVIWGFIIYTNI